MAADLPVGFVHARFGTWLRLHSILIETLSLRMVSFLQDRLIPVAVEACFCKGSSHNEGGLVDFG